MKAHAIRVAAVMPEPTPYRSPLFDRLAARPELDLTVIYSAAAIAGNKWTSVTAHRHAILAGVRVPAANRILRHHYPVTFDITRKLPALRPECVVITGWSTFASQWAIAWCRLRRVPYVLIVESHDAGYRASWRRFVKGTIVPPIVRGAASVLAAGSLASDSVIARGARPDRVRVFANTVDVENLTRRAHKLAANRDALRARLGVAPDELVVLCVARLSPEKGIDTLIQAVGSWGASRPIRLVLAGAGPERAALERLAADVGAVVSFVGIVPWDDLPELYVAADVFAMLSRMETWGVVVNEAAACGLPLVLAEQVGAAHDLLRDGENGVLVPADNIGATLEALRRLDDSVFRAAAGRASEEIIAAWARPERTDVRRRSRRGNPKIIEITRYRRRRRTEISAPMASFREREFELPMSSTWSFTVEILHVPDLASLHFVRGCIARPTTPPGLRG